MLIAVSWQAEHLANYRIGLTGGIGSGKSTVAGMFAAYGVVVLDADQIGKWLMLPGHPAYLALVSLLPSECFHEGVLDRALLRMRMLEHEGIRKTVESVLHPLIYARMGAEADAAPGAYTVLEVPLLQETAAPGFVDRVLLVDAGPDLQRMRVISRSGWRAEDVDGIMALQLPRMARLAYADDIIENTDGLSGLRQQVDALHEKYLRLADKKKSDDQMQ